MSVNRRELAQVLVRDVAAHGAGQPPKLLSSANGHVIARYNGDAQFRALMDDMDAIDADGMSLVFLSRLYGTYYLPERVATTDFFHDAARVAVEHDIGFFMLGADTEEIERAVSRVRSLYPGLRITGYRDGYFGEDEEADLCRRIRESGTDLLWVGRGIPKEQDFAVRNRDRLRGVSWVKTCGGLFNFLSGKHSRAPAWMQNAGLEWLYRTILEPGRLGKRYLVTNAQAIYWVSVNGRGSNHSPPAGAGS
ncbi:MAG: WecB/TagA/CpsF family glycosyltransferase [Geminicoccaceae bacterium]